MNHYVTFADTNYMPLALTLYESILKYSKGEFCLHFLVNSEKDFALIKNLPNIKAYLFDECKKENDCFQTLEGFTKKHNDFSPFHFMTTPVFTHHVMSRNDVSVLYLDADLFFYDDPDLIIKSIRDKSIGLCTHKSMMREKGGPNNGYFNVGSIYFANDQLGKECLEWWVSVCLDNQNPFFSVYGQCGDQKYLELFEDIVGVDNIKIIDYDIGHVAPWNINMMTLKDGYMDWDDRDNFVLKDKKSIVQKIIYMHFSHFVFNFQTDTWDFQRKDEWGGIVHHPGVREIYQDYYDNVKQTCQKYGLK